MYLLLFSLAQALTTALFRIIGNDLPPRHSKLQTLQNVKKILDHEAGSQDKYFILNRIINTTVLNTIKSWIIAKNQTFIEIKFEPAKYSKIHHDYQFHIPDMMYHAMNESLLYKLRIMDHVYRFKNIYVMNNNGGRNCALMVGKQIADVVLPLDGNIFLPVRTLVEIKDTIRKHEADYYLLTMQRSGQNSNNIWKEEPQIVFTKNSSLLFNERMRYGRRSKLELLWRLNILRPPEISIFPFEEEVGDTIKKHVYHAGHVYRLSSGQSEPESSRHVRNLLRLISIQEMIDTLDSQHLHLFNFNCKKVHYFSLTPMKMTKCYKMANSDFNATADIETLKRYSDEFSPYLLDIDPNAFVSLKPLRVCHSTDFYKSIIDLTYFNSILTNASYLKTFGLRVNLALISAISDYYFTKMFSYPVSNVKSIKILHVLLNAFQLLDNVRGYIRVMNAIPFRLIQQDCRHWYEIKEMIPKLHYRHPIVLSYVLKCSQK
eukprot:NODE_59_length_28102_cov_0.971110.p7 type:complete len:488 gc:universal NODE_59_length_28102_cov_0.971110:19904-18441(-)